MRFYLEDGRKSSSKAIKLTNQSDVKELIVVLIDKFNISKHDKKKKAVLYQVQESGKYNIHIYPDSFQ